MTKLKDFEGPSGARSDRDDTEDYVAFSFGGFQLTPRAG
jgi:hypothetical protein